jgi:hypothetical protein
VTDLIPPYISIEVHGFKWPRRPTTTASGYLLGEDKFGRWLGFKCGDPWRTADRSRAGVFEGSFVKLVPSGTYWTACFNPIDPLIDVDIVLPVHWSGNILEEIDLELDILRSADGSVRVRDRNAFARVRAEWSMAEEIAAEAEATCAKVCALVERGADPFGGIGQRWLTRFLASADALRTTTARGRS